MPVPLLDAKAAPKDAALWLEMIREQGRTHNAGPPSGRLHGRLTATCCVIRVLALFGDAACAANPRLYRPSVV